MVTYALVQSLSIPVIGAIAEVYDASEATATWVLTAYLVSAAVATPMLGRIGDMFGPVRVLGVSLGLLALGCFLASWAPNIGTMIVSRAIQGAAGGIMPLAFGIVREVLPSDRVALRVGLLNGLIAVGMATGMVVAGPLLDAWGLRGLFAVPGVVAVVALALALAVLKVPPRGRATWVNPGSALLLAGWLVLLMLGLTWAPRRGWMDGSVVVTFGAGAVLVLAWVLTDLRVAAPMIDIRLMRERNVLLGNLTALAAGFVAIASYAYIPLWVQQPVPVGFGSTIGESGVMLLPAALSTFVTGFIAVPLAARFSTSRVVVVGGLLAAAGMALMIVWHEPWTVVAACGCIGMGIGMTFASVSAAIVTMVPLEQTGVVSGMNANLRTVGGAIGTATLTSVVLAHSDSAGRSDRLGYEVAVLVLVGVALVCALAGSRMQTGRLRRIWAASPSTSDHSALS
jgi:MFS family permease